MWPFNISEESDKRVLWNRRGHFHFLFRVLSTFYPLINCVHLNSDRAKRSRQIFVSTTGCDGSCIQACFGIIRRYLLEECIHILYYNNLPFKNPNIAEKRQGHDCSFMLTMTDIIDHNRPYVMVPHIWWNVFIQIWKLLQTRTLKRALYWPRQTLLIITGWWCRMLTLIFPIQTKNFFKKKGSWLFRCEQCIIPEWKRARNEVYRGAWCKTEV